MTRTTLTAAATLALCLLLGGTAAHAGDTPATDAAARKKTWLASEFRCRAISTMKLRPCRLETKDDKVTIAFPASDITCAVEFDENGDPAKLVECRGKWLKVPETATLKRSKKRPVWSGSRKGWTWREDGQEYCCPGVWLEAPKALP